MHYQCGLLLNKICTPKCYSKTIFYKLTLQWPSYMQPTIRMGTAAWSDIGSVTAPIRQSVLDAGGHVNVYVPSVLQRHWSGTLQMPCFQLKPIGRSTASKARFMASISYSTYRSFAMLSIAISHLLGFCHVLKELFHISCIYHCCNEEK